MKSLCLFLLLVGCSAKNPLAPDAGAPPDLASGSAPDLATVAGADLATRSTQWTAQSNAQSFNAIWGTSANDLYAVGAGFNWTGYVYHSPGAGVWTMIKAMGELYAVWGSSHDDIYVGGMQGVIHSKDAGATWTVETLPAVGGSWHIGSLWGSGAGDIYAAGFSTDSGANIVGSSILHSAGNGTWVSQITNSDGAGFALWGTDAGHVYAVDRHSGAVLQSPGDGTWMTHGALGAAARIFGLTADQLYVTAANGVVFTTNDATTWTPQSIPGAAGEFIEGLWGTSRDNLFVVGNKGSIFHSDGSSWSKDGVAGTKLLAIWGFGTDNLFVVGDGGIFHRE